LETCGKISTDTVVTATSRLPDDIPREIISIGGPYSNKTTRVHLSSYCAGFSSIADDRFDQTYVSGNQKFEESDDVTWAFIVRLTSEITGREGQIILLWGATALATAAASYYLATKPGELTKITKSSMFVALNVNPHLGYRAAPAELIDVSATVFVNQQRGVADLR
jgi:hypothetical protein